MKLPIRGIAEHTPYRPAPLPLLRGNCSLTKKPQKDRMLDNNPMFFCKYLNYKQLEGWLHEGKNRCRRYHVR